MNQPLHRNTLAGALFAACLSLVAPTAVFAAAPPQASSPAGEVA